MIFFETKANYQNCTVQKCNTYKYLGVILDANSTFEAHAESNCLKLKKWVGISARLSITCSHNTIMMFNRTTLVPIFEHRIIIYGGKTLNKLQKFERLHEKTLRIVF